MVSSNYHGTPHPESRKAIIGTLVEVDKAFMKGMPKAIINKGIIYEDLATKYTGIYFPRASGNYKKWKIEKAEVQSSKNSFKILSDKDKIPIIFSDKKAGRIIGVEENYLFKSIFG